MGKDYQMDSRTVNSCWYVLLEEGITPELLLELNPSLDSGLARCALKPGLRYCVKKRSEFFEWGDEDIAEMFDSTDFKDFVQMGMERL